MFDSVTSRNTILGEGKPFTESSLTKPCFYYRHPAVHRPCSDVNPARFPTIQETPENAGIENLTSFVIVCHTFNSHRTRRVALPELPIFGPLRPLVRICLWYALHNYPVMERNGHVASSTIIRAVAHKHVSLVWILFAAMGPVSWSSRSSNSVRYSCQTLWSSIQCCKTTLSSGMAVLSTGRSKLPCPMQFHGLRHCV